MPPPEEPIDPKHRNDKSAEQSTLSAEDATEPPESPKEFLKRTRAGERYQAEKERNRKEAEEEKQQD